MNDQTFRADIMFMENGELDVNRLNALYLLIGWDNTNRRTPSDTAEMLRVSHYYIAGHTSGGILVGFARVCGDPYVAQVLDVITHPEYRRQGIATRCMQGVLEHLQNSRYVSITLTDDTGIDGFYKQFGFRGINDGSRAMRWKPGLRPVSNK
jgi:ribosomal protein S18 acetylase RimI-like enzyme